MARYISQWASFKKKVIPSVYRIIQGPSGPQQILEKESVICIFTKQGVTEHEREMALERFRFKGVAEGEDPIRRVSSYDTDSEARSHVWSDETKKEVEKALDLGQGVDYFKVEDAIIPLPWPSYDTASIKDIKTIVATAGIDPEIVLIYERQNRNRPSVLNLFADTGEVVEDEIVVNA